MRKEQLAEDVTVYCGDCREAMSLIGAVDAVVTDPPYGIGNWSAGAAGGDVKIMTDKTAERVLKWDVAPDKELLDRIRALSKEQIMWGGNYFLDHLGNCRSPLIWDKQLRGMHFADGESAWTSFTKGTLRIFTQFVHTGKDELISARQHPTQKPIGLMEWCIDQLDASLHLVMDPFMGSGTTGIACVRRKRRFVGVERDPEYFDIACQRIRDAMKQDTLF